MRAVHASHCDDDPHEGQTEDNRRSQGCPAQSERPPSMHQLRAFNGRVPNVIMAGSASSWPQTRRVMPNRAS